MLLIYLLVQAKLALLHVFVDSLRQIAVYAQKILFLKFCTSFWFSLRTCRSSFSCFALIFKNIQRANAGMMVVLCKSECCLNYCLRRCDDVMHTAVVYVLPIFDVFDDCGRRRFIRFDDDYLILHFRFELLAFIPSFQEDTSGTKLNKLPFLLNSNWTQLN